MEKTMDWNGLRQVIADMSEQGPIVLQSAGTEPGLTARLEDVSLKGNEVRLLMPWLVWHSEGNAIHNCMLVELSLCLHHFRYPPKETHLGIEMRHKSLGLFFIRPHRPEVPGCLREAFLFASEGASVTLREGGTITRGPVQEVFFLNEKTLVLELEPMHTRDERPARAPGNEGAVKPVPVQRQKNTGAAGFSVHGSSVIIQPHDWKPNHAEGYLKFTRSGSHDFCIVRPDKSHEPVKRGDER